MDVKRDRVTAICCEPRRFIDTPNTGRVRVGALVCTEGHCKHGEILVKDMQAYWKRYGFDVEKGEEFGAKFRERFGAATSALVEQYNALQASISRKVPFSPVCCQILELGRKAEVITRAMAAMAGVDAPAPSGLKPPGESTFPWGKVLIAATIGVGIMTAPKVIGALQKPGQRRLYG